MRIVSNKKGSNIVMHFTASETVKVVGNNSVSNLATDASEFISGASITQAWFGTIGTTGGNGSWSIARGANTVVVFDSSGYTDFAGNGAAMTLDAKGDLTVTLTATSGTLMLEMQKYSTVSNSQYLVG